MNRTWLVRKAHPDDVGAVAALYRDAIGTDGCTWNECYPTREDAQTDCDGGNLYVAEQDGAVVAAVSVVGEPELDDLPFWQPSPSYAEVARLVVMNARRGQGLAQRLLRAVLEQLRGQGCRAVRLLVAKGNPSAQGVYRRLHFAFVGECDRYDNSYFACEKQL